MAEIPAFPETREHISESKSGMTLRDWFAGQVLWLVYHEADNGIGLDEIAADSYAMADAMLAERQP